ncbi:MAG: uracil-DNA glycosylase family protein [Actinomycetota bacterium]
MAATSLTELLIEIRGCEVCASSLPAGPRPIVQAGASASIVIIGQAPGRRVHESGVPWDDPSGDTLRQWMGIGPDEFYDPDVVALVPMGFCYPGAAKSGDKPPRKECAPLWHDAVLGHLPGRALDIVIGTYAQSRYLPDRASTLTATVAGWERYLPERIPLPHPSPRNTPWLQKNPWFESETLPALRSRVAEVLGR